MASLQSSLTGNEVAANKTEVASLPLHPPATTVLPPSPPPATSSSPFGADMFLKLAAHPSTAHLVTLPDLVLVLLDLQHNPSQLFMHVGDIRVTQALQVLGTPLPEETVSNAFGTTMIQTLATNAATCGLVCDAKGLQNLIAIQQNPLTVNQYMTDPRIAQALTVLFQTSSTPLQNSSAPTEPAVASSNVVVEPSNDNLPAITTLSQLTAQLRSDPLKQWPLTGKYLVCGQVLGESNHCVFKAINKKRPSDDLVVKLTQQDKEDVVKLSQRVVVCEEWGAVDVLGFQCQALIMEKGQYSVGDQLRHLQGHQYPRYRCLEDILDAVVTLHQLQYVHCDLKPENVVFFGDSDGYKLVDFDNARPARTPLTKNCTEQYCPPEMAHFMLGHTTDPPVATTKYDVWCTAVLVLKLFSKPGASLIEFNDGVPLLDTIASPMFSFAESVSLTQLSSDRQKSLLKCLHIDPKQRGSLQDLVDLLPDTSTKKGGMTRMCNKLEELTVKVENNLSISTETLHVSKATYAKVVDMKRDLMKGMFEATEVTVPTSFIILPFNIQTQPKLTSQPKDLAEQATGFFHRLQTVGSTILKAIQDNNPLSATKAALDAFSKGQPMYFYLLDDVTGLPVEDETGVYPIQITTTTDQYTKFMATNMPLFQRGLKLLQMANSAAGFFKALGIPSLGEATMANIEGLLEVPGSSVSDFNVVQRALDDKTEVKAPRGPALRELERFFHDKDEAKSFAGLSRVPTDSGLATWTRL
ncbi:serine/threonine protein kinase [Aphanomyces astaci]|uniref:Serine/threonine protein kinase n=1 Tax=Aphanomyces astaci TaxID=112090 RepID=W4FSU4_APHAT|nr:serine/threonine protein kinase [Aphanomyces astaci]ETV69924.1 serine/threonine protein kinase [Aphanomyces astaci]|eukprot:XP_009840662.1 serine/threonine protein kinase [Aphanomyces astaci]